MNINIDYPFFPQPRDNDEVISNWIYQGIEYVFIQDQAAKQSIWTLPFMQEQLRLPPQCEVSSYYIFYLILIWFL